MKSLSAKMTDNNEQIKTQIKKMTIAIIAVALLIIVSFVMIVTNIFK
jgi:hypothetical protein